MNYFSRNSFVKFALIMFVIGATLLLYPQQLKAADQPVVASRDNIVSAKWCTRCHGTNGISSNPRAPNLAGQKEKYIAKQITYFQQGSSIGGVENVDAEEAMRVHRSMVFNAKRLNEEEINKVAKFYSDQPCIDRKIKPSNAPAPLEVIMSCALCHGKNGVGVNDMTPNLAGQNSIYLENQLKSFKEIAGGIDVSKLKDWRQHPIMNEMVRNLSDTKIVSLAKYYSSLGCQ